MTAVRSLLLGSIGALFFSVLSACTPPASFLPKEKAPAADSLDSHIQNTDWQKEFPSHWWKEVPREEARHWEILPQDADYQEVILSKRNELGLLSNFAETAFVFHGVCYPTVEAFWQMMKYPEGAGDLRWSWAQPWKYTREQVSQMNGYSAKSAGSYANDLMENNQANWVSFEGKSFPFAEDEAGEHYQLIWDVFIEKLRQNPQVLEVLMKTQDLKLRPDHRISAKAPREWHYNLLWMDLRKLVKEKSLELATSEDLSLRHCKSKSY